MICLHLKKLFGCKSYLFLKLFQGMRTPSSYRLKINSSKTVIKFGYSEQEICDSYTVDEEGKVTVGYDSGYSGLD